jgi:hypothetical protein
MMNNSSSDNDTKKNTICSISSINIYKAFSNELKQTKIESSKLANRETYTGLIKSLKPNEIFVFGSNPEGRHGMGAAAIALRDFGAIYGVGRGIQGKSYGLITKNLRKDYYEKETGIIYHKYGMKSISPEQIMTNIRELYDYALLPKNKDKRFLIAYTLNGRNLNGYSAKEMALFFKEASIKEYSTLQLVYDIPSNIIFEDKFSAFIFN